MRPMLLALLLVGCGNTPAESGAPDALEHDAQAAPDAEHATDSSAGTDATASDATRPTDATAIDATTPVQDGGQCIAHGQMGCSLPSQCCPYIGTIACQQGRCCKAENVLCAADIECCDGALPGSGWCRMGGDGIRRCTSM